MIDRFGDQLAEEVDLQITAAQALDVVGAGENRLD